MEKVSGSVALNWSPTAILVHRADSLVAEVAVLVVAAAAADEHEEAAAPRRWRATGVGSVRTWRLLFHG